MQITSVSVLVETMSGKMEDDSPEISVRNIN